MITLADSFNLEIETEYVEELSVSTQHRFFFTYSLTLSNPLGQPVSIAEIKLLLTDGEGNSKALFNPFQDTQPTVPPQQTYCYSNDIITTAPLSIVQGKVVIKLNSAEQIVINIIPFQLAIPNLLH